MLTARQAKNPIVWQEENHQQRSSPAFLRRWTLLFFLAIVAALVATVASLEKIDYPRWGWGSREFALSTIWIVHFFVAIRAIAAGTNAISREHVGQTWDALVLTGVSTQQILLGKWLAATRRVAPWMTLLGAVRVITIPVFTMALLNRYAYWQATYYYNSNYQYENMIPTPTLIPWAVILAVVSAVLLSVLEVMACTALGIAASAVTRRGIVATVIALSVRFAPVAIFAAMTRYDLGNVPTYRVLRYPPFAIADSGTAPIALLSVARLSWTYNLHETALMGLFYAALVLVVILGVSLFAAWAAIRLTGALPKPKYAAVAAVAAVAVAETAVPMTGKAFQTVPEV